jgi:hypothetical protein
MSPINVAIRHIKSVRVSKVVYGRTIGNVAGAAWGHAGPSRLYIVSMMKGCLFASLMSAGGLTAAALTGRLLSSIPKSF